MSLVVCFAGQIGSGKSSVSCALADKLEWSRAGFGDYLRKLATARGLDAGNRQILQDLGQSLIEQDSVSFCRAVLLDGGFARGVNMLVDGVRHVGIQSEVAAYVAPSVSKLIYLRASETERRARVKARPDGLSDFGRAEGHFVESELRGGLLGVADAIVEAEREFPVVLRECDAHIQRWLGDIARF